MTSGRWADSDRGQHLPRNWHRIRARVLARDGWTCQIRGPRCTRIATEVDHIGDRCDHREHMLQSTCHTCHAWRTSQQSTEARVRANARSLRPSESHPGLM